MTTYPGQPATPRKTLTWLAVASFVVGLALTGFFVWRIVQTAPQSPEPVGQGAVHLDEVGLTIYSSQPVLRPPCEVKDANGADLTVEPPTGSETITINSDTWYVVARTVDQVPPGDYAVNCVDDQTGTTYAVGPRLSVVGFVVSILGAIGSFLVFLILGVVLLVVGAVKRRRANRPPGNTFPGGPGGPAGYQQPGYPPPGNTFPGYPPPGNYNPGPNPDRPNDR